MHRPKFGGKYCTGERKRYRLCNVHPCRPDTPTFRQMQCSEFDTVPYKNAFYRWFPVFNPGKEPWQKIPDLGLQPWWESVSMARCLGSPAKFHRERIAPGGVLYLKSRNVGLVRLISTCWRLNIPNSVLSSVESKREACPTWWLTSDVLRCS